MVDVAINGETDVMQQESLQLRGWFIQDEEAFGRMWEPEEGGDGEINDGPVNLAFIGMVSVKGQVETMEDGTLVG